MRMTTTAKAWHTVKAAKKIARDAAKIKELRAELRALRGWLQHGTAKLDQTWRAYQETLAELKKHQGAAARAAESAAKDAEAERVYRESILADALHVSMLEAIDQLRPGMSIWGHHTVTARVRALLHFWPRDPNSAATKPEMHYVAKLAGLAGSIEEEADSDEAVSEDGEPA